jgi:dihydrofolate reductase
VIIVAVANNGVIGREGQLPWQLPDDLRRFKALTMGKPIVMGRRTHESIGRALPGRRNLVVSRALLGQARRADGSASNTQIAATASGVEWVNSLDAAIALCAGLPEICIIGGAGLYAHALPRADVVEFTRVHADPEGDVYFPPLPEAQWREVARVEHAADEKHSFAMSFLTYHRVSGGIG